MIPKIIHYCWFGRNPKPKLAKKCFKSWKKYCPNYKIIEWNEDNYDISSAPLYVQQAYAEKKWAFVTDYVRLQVVYENGGIYLDTDVELRRNLDELLQNKAYFGLENNEYINTGLGFGSEKGTEILLKLMMEYKDIPFVKEDGSYDTKPCPERNTEIFLSLGLKQDGSMQKLEDGILILPSEYLCPKDWWTGAMEFTDRTYSIHHYGESWYTPEMQRRRKKQLRREALKRLPSTIGHKLLGKEKYEKIRSSLKH